MAEYINIRGQSIEVVASDPANPTIGQIWYNSTSNTLKGLSLSPAGTWATAAALPTALYQSRGFGIQTAAVNCGGEAPGGTYNTQTTLNYDGTSWSPSGNLNGGRSYHGAAGIQTAGVVFGGFNGNPTRLNSTEEYDGSTWTSVPGTLATARNSMGSNGTQTSALCIGGYDGINYSNVEQYDGTTWTAGGAYPQAGFGTGSAGTQTAALAFGGNLPPIGGVTALSAEYNGTSWTVGNSLNTAREELAGAGIQTAALGFGGVNPPVATGATELYDGTSWSTNPGSMNTGRNGLATAVAAPSAAALGMAGNAGTATNATEEYSSPSLVTVTITAS
jgi:hypothetical protein